MDAVGIWDLLNVELRNLGGNRKGAWKHGGDNSKRSQLIGGQEENPPGTWKAKETGGRRKRKKIHLEPRELRTQWLTLKLEPQPQRIGGNFVLPSVEYPSLVGQAE